MDLLWQKMICATRAAEAPPTGRRAPRARGIDAGQPWRGDSALKGPAARGLNPAWLSWRAAAPGGFPAVVPDVPMPGMGGGPLVQGRPG
jgi:hypothetical protein